MSKLLILLAFVATTAIADDHGSKFRFMATDGTILVRSIIRTQPTYIENYDVCVGDGEHLRRSFEGTYTCKREQ